MRAMQVHKMCISCVMIGVDGSYLPAVPEMPHFETNACCVLSIICPCHAKSPTGACAMPSRRETPTPRREMGRNIWTQELVISQGPVQQTTSAPMDARRYRSVRDFKNSVATHIAEYNIKRPHAANNYLTPDEKESRWREGKTDEAVRSCPEN